MVEQPTLNACEVTLRDKVRDELVDTTLLETEGLLILKLMLKIDCTYLALRPFGLYANLCHLLFHLQSVDSN